MIDSGDDHLYLKVTGNKPGGAVQETDLDAARLGQMDAQSASYWGVALCRDPGNLSSLSSRLNANWQN